MYRYPLLMGRRLMQIASQALCLVYPEVCQACCISLATPEDGFLCEGCQRGVQPVLPPFCSRCGRPSESQGGPLEWICMDCSRRPYAFQSARAAVHASPLMLGLIHQFKYQGALWMTPFFKQLMECRWEHDHEVMACEGILPVPLHPLRKRERGYNQAAILARMVSDGHRHQWLDGVLKRIAPNPSQTMLSRSMRFKNMACAFEVQQPERIQGKKLLLIDDVLTSGATADACAQACLQAGATSVIVRTLVCVAKQRSSS